MNIMDIRPYSYMQPLVPVNPVPPTSEISDRRSVEETTPVYDFTVAMKDAIRKAMPTIPVDKLKTLDFKGISEFIAHRKHINAVVPKEMRRIAGTFQNKIAFYNVNGDVGTYDYSAYDMRI